MTQYNDISTLSQQIAYLQQQIRQLQTQPRLVSSSIDRGGTQSSDYNGSDINNPGSAGWFIGTDESTGVGYVHINGRKNGSPFYKVNSDAEQQSAVNNLHPTPDQPLTIVRSDTKAGDFRLTTDGILWQQTSPMPVPYVEPSLVNSWVNYKIGFHKAGYIKTSAGIVALSGLISSGTLGAVAFTLPVGYRPDNDLIFSIVAGNALGTVRISSSGTVTVAGASAASFTSLSGIMFPAAGVATWTPVTTFASGWASFHTLDASFGPLAYWRDVYGRVWFNGMARQTTPSTLGAATVMFTVPFKKVLTSHYPGLGNGSFATIYIGDSGGTSITSIQAHTGTTTNWVALTSSMFVDENIRSNWQDCNAFYLNSWVKYPNASFPDRKFMTFPDGICFHEGLISSGTTLGAGNTAISVLGVAGALPDTQLGQNNNKSGMEIFTITSNLAIARTNIVGIGPLTQVTGQMGWEENTGSTTWRSYAGVNYVIGA